MVYGGWVKIYRQSIENGWLRNPNLWTFWTWCLLKATHKKMTQIIGFQHIELEPGQFIFGRKAASEELKMGEQIIRTSLKNLEKSKNLTIKPTNKYTIVTICNWDIYQNDINNNNQQSNQQLTNNQPTTNHKQEVKNTKESIYSQEADEVVRYLNQKIGSKYKATSKNTLESISARLKDGFTVDDFKKVIDNKVGHWLHDDRMKKFLRPETLFAPSHFESYLNEPPSQTQAELDKIKLKKAIW